MPIVKYRTMKYIYITIISFLFLTESLFSLNSGLSIGEAHGWDKIETWTNVELFEGKGGYSSIGLKSALYETDENTDLLIHFDDNLITDASGNYSVESYIENTTKEKAMGNASGVFRGSKEAVILNPGPDTLFSGNNITDSFSIEFWLNPSRFGENPLLISYQGTLRDKKGNLIPQELSCSIKDRKLVWKLNNIFYTEDSNSNIKLTGLTSIIPNIWHHHLLRFDSATGLIEYLIDGELEVVQHASKTGTEDGTIFSPLIFSTSKSFLTLGNGYIGYMDELRISKTYIQTPVLNRYQEKGGNALSKIIDLGRANSILKNIEIEHEIPKDSAIFYNYNISNNMGTMFSDTNWVEFYPGDMIFSHNKGRYLKIKMDIRADGEEILTPSISHINIIYEKNLKPLAPLYLNLTGRNNSVSLSWSKMSDPDIEGYLIFYGTQKGIYFGSEAEEGVSPLIVKGKDITAIDITGLENGKLYYFAIAAYDDAGTDYPGELSKEKTSRPVPSGKN